MASSVDAKLLRQTKFPPEFNTKVDVKKVNIEVMKKYVSSPSWQFKSDFADSASTIIDGLPEGFRKS